MSDVLHNPLAPKTRRRPLRHLHLALHSFLRLAAMVIIGLNYEVIEGLHDIFELSFDCHYGCWHLVSA